MNYLEIDFDGNILEEFESSNNYKNDDLRNINDGTLRWIHIDKNSGILNVIKANPYFFICIIINIIVLFFI